jgi:hypothetical protein
MLVACSDSRSAPETVFDAGPGELFVLRNVGALIPPFEPDGEFHSTSAALDIERQRSFMAGGPLGDQSSAGRSKSPVSRFIAHSSPAEMSNHAP